jgi:hypothetical protein
VGLRWVRKPKGVSQPQIGRFGQSETDQDLLSPHSKNNDWVQVKAASSTSPTVYAAAVAGVSSLLDSI